MYLPNSNGPRFCPFAFKDRFWPHIDLYDKEKEIIQSVCVDRNKVTVVHACHQSGKDFVSGFICLYTFLAYKEVRIVTTSVKDDHLRVLWGEIERYIDTAQCYPPLDSKKGGPLILNHRDIRKKVSGKQCKISYLRGMVSLKGEGLAGHHAAHTLFMVDEASGCEQEAYDRGETWAKSVLIIGNPYPCPPTHFFRKAVMEGDLTM